ncbi:hypothetical protein TNCV_102371 [Trichonephila clavipes]|nr:hypothetical protein TNCV_102371 [Trichonephila clavipes]
MKTEKKFVIFNEKKQHVSYRERKSDENVIKVGNSDSSGSEYQASSFEGVRSISDRLQSCRNSESGGRQSVQGKKTNLTGDQGGRRNSDNYKRKRSVLSMESSVQMDKRTKKFLQEVTGCMRKTPSSRSGRPQRKRNKGPERQLGPDHPEERYKPKGDQSGPEEKDSRSLDRTARIQATGRSLDARVIKSRSRNRGAGDQVVKVHDEVETPDSKSARRRAEGQRVEGPHRWKSSLEMSTTKEIISQVVLFHYFFTDRQSGELLQEANLFY